MADKNRRHLDLVEALVTKARGNGWGGIIQASAYITDAMRCGESVCKSYFKGTDFNSLLKESTSRLTYAPSVEREFEAKLTGRSDLKLLLPVDSIEKFPENTLLGFHNVITNTDEDRDGDILETDGATVTKEMPLLWQHIHTLPIGKMVTVLEHTKDVLRVVTALLDLNDLTEDAAKLIEAGALAISHGFTVSAWEERNGPDGEKPKRDEFFGFRVLEFEIMEQSLVSVPSNRGAIIEQFSRGNLKSGLFKAYAKNLWGEEPVSAPVEIELFESIGDRSQSIMVRSGVDGNGNMLLPGLDFEDTLEKMRDNKSMRDATKASAQGVVETYIPEMSGPSSSSLSSSPDIVSLSGDDIECKGRFLTGSWEWVEDILQQSARSYLQLQGVSVDDDSWVHLAGTFSSHAVVFVDNMNNDKHYKIKWKMSDDSPVWSGKPEEVEISTTVESRERMLLAQKERIVSLIGVCDAARIIYATATADELEDFARSATALAGLAKPDPMGGEYRQLMEAGA